MRIAVVVAVATLTLGIAASASAQKPDAPASPKDKPPTGDARLTPPPAYTTPAMRRAATPAVPVREPVRFTIQQIIDTPIPDIDHALRTDRTTRRK